ncbi:MAG: hypothetical protein VX740_07685 [Pseudomonadota bacterium]|nr:hypothetical protein [Alphaproteobacteria bacterium]MEC7701511.1 hypothetical protein [Pseudomonadota bacterium]MED5423306.1 hypothetical protein [Pseudomonadota bacterium]MEE3322323.1 hypothetical protein [Pseudomonadota bacterium]
MNITSFMDKYKDATPEDILKAEGLERDLAAIQKEVMNLDNEAMSAEVQDVLRNIYAVLESQIVQVNEQMKEQKGKMLLSNKRENACLAYLQSAGAGNKGRR